MTFSGLIELNCCVMMASPCASSPVIWLSFIAAPTTNPPRNASFSVVAAGAWALAATLDRNTVETKSKPRLSRIIFSIFPQPSFQNQPDNAPSPLRNTFVLHLECLAPLAQIVRDGQVQFHVDAIEHQARRRRQEPYPRIDRGNQTYPQQRLRGLHRVRLVAIER